MKFVTDTVEFMNPSDIMDGCKIQKHLELCGRTCYNSTNAIKDGSDEKFIKGIIESGHTSVLEHASICIRFNGELDTTCQSAKFMQFYNAGSDLFVSGNVRAWRNYIDEMEKSNAFAYWANIIELNLHHLCHAVFTAGDCSTEEAKDMKKVLIIDDTNFTLFGSDIRKFYGRSKYYTFKITCSRACQNQLVRHRLASFSVQSQRYCNYSNPKFADVAQIMAINKKYLDLQAALNQGLPTCYHDEAELERARQEEMKTLKGEILFIEPADAIAQNTDARTLLEKQTQSAEDAYFCLVQKGIKPEDAREVLPNNCATIVVMSAPKWEWDNIFALRCDSHAQAEVRKVCEMIRNTVYALNDLIGTDIGVHTDEANAN